MAQSKYLRRVNAANRNLTGQSDMERGWDFGSKIGTSLSGAIQSYQKDQLANKLMNTMDAPRAALVSAPNTGGPQPAQGDQNTVDPNADLSTDLPEDVSSQLSTPSGAGTFTNPSTGNIEPLQGGDSISGTNTSNVLSDSVAASKAAQTLPAVTVSGQAPPTPNALPAGLNVKGTAPHRGGVAELALMKEGLELQSQKATIADKLAEAAGTGRYAAKAKAVPKGGYRMSTGGNNPWDNADDDGTSTDGTSTDGSGTGSSTTGKSKKPPPYVGGTFDAENDAPNDNYHKIQTDFDGRYGGGAFKRVAPLLGNTAANSDGSYDVKDPKDDTKTMFHIDSQTAKYFLDRMNNVGNRQGMAHIGPLGEGANRYSNADPGTETNPVVIHNNREFFALPYGTVAKDLRTGAVVRRLAPGAPGATHG